MNKIAFKTILFLYSLSLSQIFLHADSFAERANFQMIENLGVSPDIVYEVTADDLQNDYRGYIKAVNEAVKNLLIR